MIPVIPDTLILEGYGAAGSASNIWIAAELVNDLVPIDGALTVTAKLSLEEFTPSLTVIVMVAVPVWPAAGVIVRVRLEPLPPKTILLVGMSVGLEEFLRKTRLFTGVSESAMVNAMGPIAVSTPVD